MSPLSLAFHLAGGIFDPFGFAKGNKKELQTKEIKNGRLAMVHPLSV